MSGSGWVMPIRWRVAARGEIGLLFQAIKRCDVYRGILTEKGSERRLPLPLPVSGRNATRKVNLSQRRGIEPVQAGSWLQAKGRGWLSIQVSISLTWLTSPAPLGHVRGRTGNCPPHRGRRLRNPRLGKPAAICCSVWPTIGADSGRRRVSAYRQGPSPRPDAGRMCEPAWKTDPVAG